MKRWEVNKESGCWEWALHLDPRGYGRLTWAGKPGTLAHRWSYEQANGPIPEGMTVDHQCFNPPCVNPEHLRLLTFEENVKNQRSTTKTHCINGHEYTPENTYMRPAKHRGGRRDCRTCIRERVRQYNQKTRRAA